MEVEEAKLKEEEKKRVKRRKQLDKIKAQGKGEPKLEVLKIKPLPPHLKYLPEGCKNPILDMRISFSFSVRHAQATPP